MAFSPIKPPEEGDDTECLWLPVDALCKFANAMLRLQVRGRDCRPAGKLTVTEGNAVLEIDVAAVAAATVSYRPFEPYRSPLATGAAAGRTIMIGTGFVVGLSGHRFPLRRNIQIVVPANCTTGYYVWLQADLAPTTGDMTALDYGHGTDLPVQAAPDTTTGLLPTVVYLPLFYVTSTATDLDDWSRNLMVRSCLKLVPQQASYSGSEATRYMDWQAINSDESFDPTVFQVV